MGFMEDFITIFYPRMISIVPWFYNELSALAKISSDITSTLNEILNLPIAIMRILGIFLNLVWYPITLINEMFYNMIAYIWFVCAGSINLIINIPMFALNIFNLFFSATVPPIWGALLFLAILMNISIRVAAFGVWIYRKIPVFGGH